MLKRVELAGRRLLVRLLGLVFGVAQRRVELPPEPRILVVRLDERVGNALLLTPLLATLRLRYPRALLDVVGHVRTAALLSGHPALNSFIPFDKRALFSSRGPLRLPLALRRTRYDLAIDASNPTDPSLTQAYIVRAAAARCSIGAAHGPFTRWFTSPVEIRDDGSHEIDLRLRLLRPLPEGPTTNTTSVSPPSPPGPAIAALIERTGDYVVLNVGARLAEKTLSAARYAELAQRVAAAGLGCVVTYGPAEALLARAVTQLCSTAVLAPPTELVELAQLMHAARAVVSCDTGPMHLAVALGTPTCGIFVSTPPERYGYKTTPHAAIDARGGPSDALAAGVATWLANVPVREPRRT